MTTPQSDRVIIKDFAWEISQAKADEYPEHWDKIHSDTSLRRTIVAAMNQHGWPPDGIPGLIPLILKMLEDKEIKAFSTFNGLPCTDFELVKVNPSNWFISGEDANRVRNTMVLEQFTVKGISSISTMNRATYEEYQKAQESRLSVGRYTLEEAARFVEKNSNANADSIFEKLKESAKTGELEVFAPGSDEVYKPKASRHAPDNVVRGWYEEAYWNNLNDWLKLKEPRLDCKFPQPNAPAVKVEAVPVTSPSGKEWKTKARAIADSEALKRYARGEREITARNICGAVATELAKDSTTHGTRGERASGSIRNEALKGWKFIPRLAQTAKVARKNKE